MTFESVLDASHLIKWVQLQFERCGGGGGGGRKRKLFYFTTPPMNLLERPPAASRGNFNGSVLRCGRDAD